jgi:hypothetical protein
MADQNFICPECGSTAVGCSVFVSTSYDKNDPWSAVLQRCVCLNCQSTIPAHLGERWNDMTYDEACAEWRLIYKGKQ